MFANKFLRKIFAPKRDWMRLHEEPHDLYASPNIIRVIKLRIRWARHVARMRRRRVCTGFCWGNLRVRGHLEDLVIGGRIIFKWIFKKYDGMYCIDVA